MTGRCICCNKTKEIVEVVGRNYPMYKICKRCYDINKETINIHLDKKQIKKIADELEKIND